MNGIEKITDKIIADARTDAQAVIDEARREAEEIGASAEARAEAIAKTYSARADELRADLESRTESASASERRNASLNARARLVDRVFNEARDRILAMDGEEYYAFLEGLLGRVIADRATCDAANEAGTDEYDEFDRYELSLNERDAEKYGQRLVKAFGGKAGEKKLVLSGEKAPIDGGFMLRWGQVDMNCSISGLIARSRDNCERGVCDILYPRGNEG